MMTHFIKGLKMNYKNDILIEFFVGIAMLFIVCSVLMIPFGFGNKYTVKIRGEVMHENVQIYQDRHNNTLTVYDKDGTIHMYNGNWELVKE